MHCQKVDCHASDKPNSLMHEAVQVVTHLGILDLSLSLKDVLKQHITDNVAPDLAAPILAAISTDICLATWSQRIAAARLGVIEGYAASGVDFMHMMHTFAPALGPLHAAVLGF